MEIGRKVIDNGRKSLQRLTKIEANLRELRVKYVGAQAGSVDGVDMNDPESDMEIAIEDLFYTQQHKHEEFVFAEGMNTAPKFTLTKFKTTAEMAKEE